MLFTLWVQVDLRWRNLQNFETLEAGRAALAQRSLGNSRLLRLTRYQFHEQIPIMYAIHGEILVPERGEQKIVFKERQIKGE